MTLLRTIVVLLAALALMLCVVMLRAETTRLHYEISQRERRAEELRLRLRQAELELARQRNPMMIRKEADRAAESLLETGAAPAAPRPRGRP